MLFEEASEQEKERYTSALSRKTGYGKKWKYLQPDARTLEYKAEQAEQPGLSDYSVFTIPFISKHSCDPR